MVQIDRRPEPLLVAGRDRLVVDDDDRVVNARRPAARCVANGGAMSGVGAASPNWNNCSVSIARSRPATLSTTSDALRSITGLPPSVSGAELDGDRIAGGLIAALFGERPRDGHSGEEKDGERHGEDEPVVMHAAIREPSRLSCRLVQRERRRPAKVPPPCV